MGRLNSALLQRASPAAPRPHKHARPATRSAQHQKPPSLAKSALPRSPGLRSRLYSSNTNRFLLSRTQLPAIQELPEEGEEDGEDDGWAHPRPDTEPWRGDARPGPSRVHDQDAEMSSWDDESTLVAMLQDHSPEPDEDEQLLELVHSLKAPLAAQGAVLKQYLADTVLPAYSHVKDVHGVLEDKVDLEFGAGLLTFDEVCKKVERIALKDEDEIKTAHAQSQRNIAKTIAELEQAYEHRKTLWTGLQAELDRCAARATAALDALPVDLEQAIAILEKKSKAVEKDTSAASNQGLLRGLLEKL